jgi:hypothetical protein
MFEWIPVAELSLLNEYVSASANAGPKPRGVETREALSERLAMRAVIHELQRRFPGSSIEDANASRKNQPGFDVLIDRKVKIQIKGSTYVECVQWFMKPSLSESSMDFDYLIAVDLGCMLNSNVGRLAKWGLRIRSEPDFYVLPKVRVETMLANPRMVNGRGVAFYLYHRPVKPGTSEDIGQFKELAAFRSRFDLIRVPQP